MPIGPVRPQYVRQTVLPAQTRVQTATLYRGLKTRPEFFHEDNAQRFQALQKKWDTSIYPGTFDRLVHKLTGRPYISATDAGEFMRLRSIACDQSFSDKEEVAADYAGQEGFLSVLSLPFEEALGFMEMRTLISDDHLSAENVFFIPAIELLENLRSGHWMFAVKILSHHASPPWLQGL